MELLLGEEGIQCPTLTERMIRRLILQERDMIANITTAGERDLLTDGRVHSTMELGNPFVESAVRRTLSVFCGDIPIIPRWERYNEPTRTFLAYLCALSFLNSCDELRKLGDESTLDERERVIAYEVRCVLRNASDSMIEMEWRPITAPGPRRAMTIDLQFPAFPCWDRDL